MTNEGNKLTKEHLIEMGFEREVFHDRDGDEVKVWIKSGITLYEDSWWLTELDKDGDELEAPVLASVYKNQTPPEITFSYATYIKGDGRFKGGFIMRTDTQVKNLYFALTNKTA